MRGVEHTSHGVPLEQYILTRRDHNEQRTAEYICAAAEEAEEKRLAEEAADLELKVARAQRAREVWEFMLANHAGPHEIMRWRVRLYCGHIVETQRHATIEAPNMHGSWAKRCSECGMDPALIVAWEPIGPVAERPCNAAERLREP